MQSIGQRLEEARKRKGISLREAAEATKIRSDFLGSIEQDKFDFELPDIYKRGFIKNYASFLKLDSQDILTDYSAHLLGKTRGSKKGAELFGSMEVKGQSSEEPVDSSSEPSYGRMTGNSPSTSQVEAEDASHSGEETETDKIFYIKAGLIAVGTLALVFVIFGLIKAILGSDTTEVETPPLREPAAINETAAPTSPTAPTATNGTTAASGTSHTAGAAQDSITLIASGNVYVLVKQRNDNQELFRKTLSGGETVTLSKTGPVDILFTAGENLVIVNPAGEKLRPKGEGTAKISIP